MKTLVKSMVFGSILLFSVSCENEATIALDETTTPETATNETEPIESDGAKGPWSRVFVDTFNSNGNLNQWQKTNRADYNSNRCKYRSWIPAIASLDGRSSLRLRAYKSGNNYISGHVKSYYNFEPGNNQEFMVRARIKLIARDGNGYKGFAQTYGAWPAFWTVNESNWPTRGEIDIMEGYSFGNYARFASNMFYGRNVGQNQLGTSAERGYSNGEGWHTYQMNWRNRNGWRTVDIYVDGRKVANYSNNTNGNLRLQNFDNHNIILNLNVGSDTGIFNNNNINLFSRVEMYIDWVDVHRRSI